MLSPGFRSESVVPRGRLISPHSVPTGFAAGGFQVPLRIDGPVALGQYNRIIRTKRPFGAGSQLASRAAPGDSFWM
jgi:hypothetical protein